MNRVAILEGLLFIVGEEGLEKEKLMEILEVTDVQINVLFSRLKEKYNDDDSGIKLEVLANTYKLTTKAEHIDYYKKIIEQDSLSTLSQSTLETLAIIAYNEPITRAKIDEIRGVNSTYAIRKLVICDFIKSKGKADTPGKPNLYGITDNFLDYFGLSSVDDLPNIDEFNVEHLVQDEDLFKTEE